MEEREREMKRERKWSEKRECIFERENWKTFSIAIKVELELPFLKNKVKLYRHNTHNTHNTPNTTHPTQPLHMRQKKGRALSKM